MTDIPTLDRATLALWTVYDRPKDYPSNFVARLSLVGTDGVQLTEHLLVSTDLAAIRAELMARGLSCLTRHPDDEPHIVEVWL